MRFRLANRHTRRLNIRPSVLTCIPDRIVWECFFFFKYGRFSGTSMRVYRVYRLDKSNYQRVVRTAPGWRRLAVGNRTGT